MNNDILLVIIFLIFLMLILFLITYYKKENFSQCKELEEEEAEILTGLCKPFYGIPPAAQISPYFHLPNRPTYKYEPDEVERKKKKQRGCETNM